MNEEVKGKVINSCNIISNETKNLAKAKQTLLTATNLCTLDTISINDMNMKDSIENLSNDIDKINTEIKHYIEDINEEIMVMSKVV